MSAHASLPVVGAVPPLALAVRTPAADLTAEALLAPQAQLILATTPLLCQSLERLGAQQRSAVSFELRDLRPQDPRVLALARLVPPSSWVPATAVAAARAAGGLHLLPAEDLRADAETILGTELPTPIRTTCAPGPARVVVRRSGRRLQLRVAATGLTLAGLDLSTVLTPARRPARVLPHVALLAVEEALAAGLLVVDADGRGQVQQLRRTLASALVVLPSGHGPGRAEVVSAAPSGARGSTALRVEEQDPQRALARPARLRAVHPEVSDVAAMAEAAHQATTGAAAADSELRDYQQIAVALHTATARGYVNLSAPGLGKTVMALVGLRARAMDMARWRGLICVPAAVREQWATETARWFPEATVTVIRGLADVAAIPTALAARADRTLLIVSHELLPAAGPALLRARFADLVCDEAMLLRNPTSVRGRLLWKLRERAEVAVALTGSPPAEQLGPVVALAAWCRQRPELLGAPVPADAATLARLLGPVLFRQDQRVLNGEVDVTDTELVTVTPSAAEVSAGVEAAGAAAAAVQDWAAAPRSAAARLRPAATSALARARAALSDPLAGEGAGTKRAELVRRVSAAAAAGQKVLVFTDMAASARASVGDLLAAGVSAAALVGGQSAAARSRVVQRYLSGPVGCLVVTPAGQEGLNLQVTDLVVHLDVPLEVAPLLQRQSRARRIGGTGTVTTVALVTPGFEEAAARQVLAELAAELTGAGRLEGGAGGASSLARAAALLGELTGSPTR